jgi:hypothetical protein
MIKELFELVKQELKSDSNSVNNEDILRNLTEKVYSSLVNNEAGNVEQLNKKNDAFIDRNYKRWKSGFQKLQMLQAISLEAGMDFQKQFIQHTEFENDPLLGVLMRQHANACRITGEIILLLKGGYADGALARWRTLFEISINCLVIHKHGRDAAKDYIRHGRIKVVEGMHEYHKTANDMNQEPYSEDELNNLNALEKVIVGDDKGYNWARKYTNSGKLGKLMEHIGLGKWSHNYKLASQHVHADYKEMLSLFAMADAKQDGLLVGPSNSGLVEPAHMTAITLSQITATFLTSYINDSTNLDYSNSVILLSLIQKYVDAVGKEFLACSNET